MDLKKEIGRRIRLIRAAKKMTQEQMAKKVSVSPATVSGWEIGDIGISIEAATRVAKFAGVSLDWLLAGKEEAHGTCPDNTHTPEETRLLGAFRGLNKANQAALLRIIETMRK